MSQREDGFTMIEVLMAAFCLALIVGAVATLFVTGNRSSLAGQRQGADRGRRPADREDPQRGQDAGVRRTRDELRAECCFELNAVL